MGIRQYKNKPECKIAWCSKVSRTDDLCGAHYARVLKYGSPFVEKRRSEGMDWIKRSLRNSTDECVVWPFSVSGYGYPILSWRGKAYRAHRVVCRLAHGKPNQDDLHAAHTCGNRACVNHKHIRWATAKENIADKAKHGTLLYGEDTGNAKLSTADAVQAIALIRKGVSCAEIGRRLNVSRATISKIKNGNNWGWLSGF